MYDVTIPRDRRPSAASLLAADVCVTRTHHELHRTVTADAEESSVALARSAKSTVKAAVMRRHQDARPLGGDHDDRRLAHTLEALHDASCNKFTDGLLDLDGFTVQVPLAIRNDAGGWDATLISASTDTDEDDHLDAALVLVAADDAGVAIGRITLAHARREYRKPALAADSAPTHELVAEEDLTVAANARRPDIARLRAQAAVTRATPTAPTTEMGSQCNKRGRCRYASTCHMQELDRGITHPLRLLPRLSPKLKAALEHAGHTDIRHIPLDFTGPTETKGKTPAALTEIQRMHARAIQADGWAFDPDSVAAAFADSQFPVTFLDYETVALVDGVTPGDKAFRANAMSYSARTLYTDGVLIAAGMVAVGESPEAELGEALLVDLPETGTIFGYGAAEHTITKTLIAHQPALAEQLESIRTRIQDQHATWGTGMAHAAMRGKTGAKDFAKHLGSDADQYAPDGLQSGTEVQGLWLRARHPATRPSDRESIVTRIQHYNDHDTHIQLVLFRTQMGIARLAQSPPPFVIEACRALDAAGLRAPDMRVHVPTQSAAWGTAATDAVDGETRAASLRDAAALTQQTVDAARAATNRSPATLPTPLANAGEIPRGL